VHCPRSAGCGGLRLRLTHRRPDGITTIPLVIVAVVVSFVLSKWLAGPPTAAQVPEPAAAAVLPQVR